MDDRAAARRVDQRGIFLDRVEHLHLVAPPIGPGGDADVLAYEQRGNLISLARMVKGADAKAEFVRDVDHVRHLVGAIAMILDQNLASQHPSERFELQVALRRIARAVALLPSVPLDRKSTRLN